jgi:hypothetical protein
VWLVTYLCDSTWPELERLLLARALVCPSSLSLPLLLLDFLQHHIAAPKSLLKLTKPRPDLLLLNPAGLAMA